MIVLRPYQARAHHDIREAYRDARRICYVAPTGAGKTATAAKLLAVFVRQGRRVLWLTHRIELIAQTARALRALGLRVGYLVAGHAEDRDAPIQVASVATLTSRGEAPDGIDVIVADECHHLVAASWRAIVDAYPSLELLLGLTATPERGDGTALGDVFERLVLGPTIPELVAWWREHPTEGLVPARVFAPAAPSKALAQDPADVIVAGGPMSHTIAFCRDVAHALEVAEVATSRGHRTIAIRGDMPDRDRAAALAAYTRGDVRALTTVQVLTEGTDLPCTDRIVHAARCSVWSAWMQKCGRGMRPHPGKSAVEIHDLHGIVWEMGLPDARVEFSLEGRAARAVEADGEPALRQCRGCLRVLRTTERTCPACGATLPRPPRPKVKRAPMTVVLGATRDQTGAYLRAQVAACKRHGWKIGRAAVLFNAKFRRWPTTQEMSAAVAAMGA